MSRRACAGGLRKFVATFLAVSCTLGASSAFAADKFGNIWLNASLNMHGDDIYGSVEFKKSGITLDCEGGSIIYVNEFDSPARCLDSDNHAQSCAVSSRGFDNITVKNCNIRNSGPSSFMYGIYVSGTSSKLLSTPQLFSNNIEGMNGSGIYLNFTSTAWVDKCWSTGNVVDGATVLNSTETGITNGYFEENGSSGIYEGNGFNNSFEVNSMSDNVHGFYSADSTGRTYLYRNSFFHNTFSGISFNHVTGFTVDGPNGVYGGNVTLYGIRVVGGSKGGIIRNSTAIESVTCDAQQSSTSTSISWTGNTFTKRCNVPVQ
ncbi:MAG: right-handed parallel beta-helix repeat-containing protein [Polyangiaceae bacterium]